MSARLWPVPCELSGRIILTALPALPSMSSEAGLAGKQERFRKTFEVSKFGFLPVCSQTEPVSKVSHGELPHARVSPRSHPPQGLGASPLPVPYPSLTHGTGVPPRAGRFGDIFPATPVTAASSPHHRLLPVSASCGPPRLRPAALAVTSCYLLHGADEPAPCGKNPAGSAASMGCRRGRG